MEKALKKHLPDGKFQGVSEQRSKAMSAVHGKGNKSTELRLQMALVRAGVTGWIVRPKGLDGNPDFYFPENKLYVFVDGCFWHGCPKCGHIPYKNRAFWKAKIERNSERDKRITRTIRAKGNKVIRLWEHQLKDDLEGCVNKLCKT